MSISGLKVHSMPLYGHIGARRLVRTFVAIPTPEEIVRRLMKLSARFQWPGCKVRWSTADQFHLTVQFLGNVEWIEVGKIGQTIKEVASEFPPITLRLQNLTVFPAQNQPRVIVAALEPDPVLTELVETMQQALLEDHEIVPEKRLYRPHITLGRVKSVADIAAGEALRAELAAIDTELLQSWGEWEANELTFFQSNLDGGRAEYIELAHAPLEAAVEEPSADTAVDDEDNAADDAAAEPVRVRDARGSEDRTMAALVARARAGGAADAEEDPVDRAKRRHRLAFHEAEPADADFEIELDTPEADDEADENDNDEK